MMDEALHLVSLIERWEDDAITEYTLSDFEDLYVLLMGIDEREGYGFDNNMVECENYYILYKTFGIVSNKGISLPIQNYFIRHECDYHSLIESDYGGMWKARSMCNAFGFRDGVKANISSRKFFKEKYRYV